jgi:phosphatidylserine/phosphatidylglycerophosphate/cardiolipin synthase-like enzyme
MVEAGGHGIEELVPEVGRTRWTPDNEIRLLVDPDEAWQARLELIESARHHIFFSTFSWHDDWYGREFAKRLAAVVQERRRSNPGFVVYCLIDSSAMGIFNRFSRTFAELKRAGAEVHGFNPASASAAALFEGRLHDKVLIADGRRAIVSGRNIAEEYFDAERWWLDLGLVVEGEAVWDLQMNYLKEWVTALDLGKAARFFEPVENSLRRVRTLWRTGRLPDGSSPLEPYLTPEFFPQPAAGPEFPRTVAVLYDNSLVWPRAATTDLLVELVRAAGHEIDLMSPFPNFVEELTQALEEALDRGVRVRLFINGQDAAIRRGPFWRAGLPTVIRLIAAGAEVWAWSGDGVVRRHLEEIGCRPRPMPPIALHGKLARIDDRLVIIHSSNFNIRSTFYNTEAGLAVLDEEFNGQVEELLDGLITLRSLTDACSVHSREIDIGHIVGRLDRRHLSGLRNALGGSQRFLDSWSVLW